MNKLNILSEEYNKNPYYFIEKLDRSNQIVFDESLNSNIVICYKTAKEILSKDDIFTTEPLAARAEPVMRGKVLAQMRGEEHSIKKSLITKQITGKNLNDLYKPYLENQCDEIIQNIKQKDEIDFIDDFAKIYSIKSTFKILGISEEKLDFYHERLKQIVKFATGFNLDENEKKIYIDAACEMEDDIINTILKKNISDDDVISYILRKVKESEKYKLTNQEIVSICLNILLAASEPVDKVLSICLYHLYRNQEYINKFISNDIDTNDILQESLRVTPPVHLLPRLVTENYTTKSGVKFKKDEIIIISIPAINRDPEYFDNPNKFIPERKFKGHLSYGFGIHTCIGAQFANLQLNIALKYLIPLLLEYKEKSPPIFRGIYTRGAIQYNLTKS